MPSLLNQCNVFAVLMDCIDSTFEAKLACLSCNIIKLQQTLKNTEL